MIVVYKRLELGEKLVRMISGREAEYIRRGIGIFLFKKG